MWDQFKMRRLPSLSVEHPPASLKLHNLQFTSHIALFLKVGSNERHSQFISSFMSSNSTYIETPGLPEFLEQYHSLSEDAQRYLEIICGQCIPSFLHHAGLHGLG